MSTATTTPTTESGPVLREGTWTIDQAHTTVGFSVRHLGLSKVRGRFTTFDGSVTVGERLEDTDVRAEIELDSVDTNNPDRDAHLRSADFFDAEENRSMTFRSTAVSGGPEDYRLVGELTIGDVTDEVELDVEFLGVEEYGMDDTTRAGFSATGSISRSDFGVDFQIPMGEKVVIGDKVTIELDVQLIAP